MPKHGDILANYHVLDVPTTMPGPLETQVDGRRKIHIDSLDDATGWTADSGSAPSLNTTAGNFTVGSGCFAFTHFQQYSKESAFSSIDMSGGDYVVLMRYYVAAGTVFNGLHLGLISGDDSGNLGDQWLNTTLERAEGWHELQIAIPDASGSYDPADITGYAIKTDNFTSGTVYFDEIMIARSDPFLKPTIILGCDDGYSPHKTFFAPLFEKYGFRGYFAITRSNILNLSNMLLAEAQELYGKGHDMIPHSNTHHLTWWTLGETAFREEWETPRRWMIDNGMSRCADLCMLTVSSGSMTYTQLKWLLQSYKAVIGYAGINVHNLSFMGIQDSRGRKNLLNPPLQKTYVERPPHLVDVAITEAEIDEIIDTNSAGIFLWHRIDGVDGTNGVHQDAATIESRVDYIAGKVADGDLRVMRLSDWINEGVATKRYGFDTFAPTTLTDTSGATLTELEDEVNELKARMRSLGIILT